MRKAKKQEIDLGHNHTMRYTSWAPDKLRENIKQYGSPLPNVPRAGAIITHITPEGEKCWAHINFDLPELRKHFPPNTNYWQVQSWDPLTVSPSLLCTLCKDHGFIREGKWVPA